MSKFNSYAKELDKAFKEAREAYQKLENEVAEAEAQVKRFSAWRPEKLVGDRQRQEADLLRAKARLQEAQADRRHNGAALWGSFEGRRNELRAALAAAIKAENTATPDGIDQSGLELLKSGILTADDMESLVSKYDGNPTMLRLAGKYAKEMADTMKDPSDAPARARLYGICAAVKDGEGRAMRAFDTLVSIADRCINNPLIADKWEQLTENAVEDF